MAGDSIDPYELNRTLAVWRSTLADDGQGGQDPTPGLVGTVQAKVNQPTAAERIEAARSGADLTYVIHLMPGTDVRRMDELRGDGEVFRVKSTVGPSRAAYLRAECERDQVEDN